MFMLAKSQFCHIVTLTMPNSDGNENELENSPTPTSIPPNGSPNTLPISKTPNFEDQVSVSLSTEEVNKRSFIGDENDDYLKNSLVPTSINPTGYPISVSVSKTPKSENQASVSRSTKRSRIGDENDDEAKKAILPASINPIGSLNSVPVSKRPKSESLVSVSRSTKELKKRHEIDKTEGITINSPTESPIKRSLGDETDENDEGFITPTDINHRIPELTKCPPAPRKPGSRKSKSPPATAARRSLFPVDVSDEEAESLFPPRVED